jgi:cold shock CspA family protein
MIASDDPPAPEREFGSVIFFHEDKGYGFIRTENTLGADVWFHLSHVEDRQPLRTGQHVSFVISTDHRGRPRATDIKVEAE